MRLRDLMAVRRKRFSIAPFYAHVGRLSLATVGAQVVQLVASVFLARLYTPTEFGEFSVAFSVSCVLAALATMRLEAAVPLAKDDHEAATITAAAMWWVITTAIGLTGVLFAHAVLTEHAWTAFGAGQSVWLIPPMVAALGAWSTLRMLQSRLQRFTAISVSSVTGAAVQSVGQLVAGLAGAGSIGLSTGYALGRLWNALSLRRGTGLTIVWRPGPNLRATAPWRRFSLLMIGPSILNMVSVSSIAPIVALMYGVAFSGIFSFATRILAVPSALLGQALSVVFYPKVAEMERRGAAMTDAIMRAVTGLLMISVPTFGLVMALGPELFALVFGPTWRTSGTVAAALAPWLAASFISSPLSGLMTVKNQLPRVVAISIVEITARIGGLAVGVILGEPMLGVAAYSAAGVLISAYSVSWSLRLAGTSTRAWIGRNRRYLAVVLVGYSILFLGKGRLPLPAFVALVAVLEVALLSWAAWWLFRVITAGKRLEPSGSDRRQPTGRPEKRQQSVG